MANVFAIRFSEWQSLWRMLAFAKLNLPLEKNGVKKVLYVTSILPGLHLPHQQAEACHALPLLLIKDGLGSNIGLNIN
jgi:hypothetical protein